MLKLSRLPSGEPEVFASIQGEGVSAGRPSTFVRLSLCNLVCSWCDTKYTWDWEHHDPKKEIVLAECADVVERVSELGLENVVITGGEPLMQQVPLSELAAALTARGHSVEVETNGTFQPQPAVARSVAQWNVSPKLTNSANSRAKREVSPALRWFAASAAAWFKFVISDPSDLTEVEGLVDGYSIPRGRVILMPEGITASALDERSGWIADACAQRGFRFTTRLHILLWGDERGR